MKKAKKLLPWASLLLLAVFTVIIFSFSADTAAESTDKSSGIVEILQDLCDFLGIGIEVDEKPVRKAAHFAEFALLGILAYVTAKQFRFGAPSALLYSLLVAVLDETIQSYSPERFSSTKDVLLDFCGALFGVLCIMIINRVRTRKKKD